jgi:uncharacterized protein YfaT (DUF1175 family)
MCPNEKPVKDAHHHRLYRNPAPGTRVFGWVALLALLPVSASLVLRRGPIHAEGSRGASAVLNASAARGARASSRDRSWHDSLGDGFPDSARLDSTQDRENFLRWFTFLAETQYYLPSPRAQVEVQDCAALIRFAYRNSLVAHSPAWRADAGLPFDPAFGDVAKFTYPNGSLGRALFRTRPGPAEPADLEQGAFAEFADSATLLRYNAFPVARDLRAARPGDLLFYHQPAQREPFHTMLFVGNSYYQPQGSDWIVYHTGDLNGRRGEVREVRAETLFEHPDPHWRPLSSNPNFLGVYRWEVLR